MFHNLNRRPLIIQLPARHFLDRGFSLVDTAQRALDGRHKEAAPILIASIDHVHGYANLTGTVEEWLQAKIPPRTVPIIW